MLEKLKRIYLLNRLKFKSGTGIFLCVLGGAIIIKTLPSWIFGMAIGGGVMWVGWNMFRE